MSIQTTSGPAAIVTSASTVVWGYNAAEWGIIGVMIGAACAIITTAAYIYFNYKRSKH